MSQPKQDIAILDAIILINSLLQLVGRANQAAAELMAVFTKARSENRDLTDAELDDLRQKSIDARNRLVGG